MIPLDFFLFARRFSDDRFGFHDMPWGDMCTAARLTAR